MGTADIVNGKCQRGEFKRKRQRKKSWRQDDIKRKLPILCERSLPGGMNLVTSLFPTTYCDQRVIQEGLCQVYVELYQLLNL